MRTPGLYSIALHAGGPKNGVLTAVEDFLSSPVGHGWTSMIVPAAYGLGILYQPSAANMPAACREHLCSLCAAVALLERFFETYETNHLTLLLWSEKMSVAYRKLEETYQGLVAHSNAQEEDYRKLEEAYQGLLAHSNALEENSNALEEEYRRLLSVYTKSNKEHAEV